MGGIPLKRLQEEHNFTTCGMGVSQESGMVIDTGEAILHCIPRHHPHHSQVDEDESHRVQETVSLSVESPSSATDNSINTYTYNHSESDSNSNLIINYLPLDLDESALKALFSEYGRISHVKVVRDRTTKKSLGYGFVKFLTNQEASEAVQGMNGYFIRQKRIKVSFARPSTEDIRDSKIFVQNLPLKWNDNDVQNFFSKVFPIVH